MDTVWKIKLFGGLQAIPQYGGSAVTRFRTRRAAALLAVLAFRLGKTPPTRDELIEILWPYADPVAALARLAVELTGLRKQLEASGVGNGAVIIADRFTISLDPQRVTVDVADFEAALSAVRAAATPSDREARLAAAIDIYAGPLLPQMDGDWIEPERERLAQRFVEAVSELIDSLQKRGDAADALEVARSACRCERLREPMHLLVARCELSAGRPADALRSLDELRGMMRETLGISEPSVAARNIESEARRMLAAPIAPNSHRAATTAGESPVSESRKRLPLGTLTLLATDIEGSTALGRSLGEDRFALVLAGHHALLRAEFARAGGTEFKEAGDGFWVAFDSAQAALRCARACQQAISAGVPVTNRDGGVGRQHLRIRIAIHVADLRHIDTPVELESRRSDPGAMSAPEKAIVGGSYRGLALHDLSRLLSATNGGQIFLSEAAESVSRHDLPDGMTLVNRGRYRLRDAPAPTHIFEALLDESTGAADSTPPNAPALRTPTGLPAPFTRFFGRDREIATISEALDEGRGVRLLTLTGLGGSGKTRLAAEVAQAVSSAFGGAVWFVSLVDTDDTARILDIVRAVVAPDCPGDAWEAIGSIFGTDPGLLILDNLEHLLGDSTSPDPGAPAFLQALLEKFPTISCMVTSRQRIGIGAEQEFAVQPLATPIQAQSKTISPSAAKQYASVMLFEDRAKRVRFDFQVTERNSAAVSSLCAHLEGIPLAIELAAAWARLLSPAEMLTQFDEIRRTRDRAVPMRHRSLDAAIEGSYRLLDDEQRAFFRRLSVFRGGWTLDAAKAVCDEPMALALLGDLIDRSLAVVEEIGDSSRYRFLETVRVFAGAQLAGSQQECAELHDRFVDFYASLATEANDALQGPDQAIWLTRLASEHQNLTRVLEIACDAIRLRMAGHLHRYWIVRGNLTYARNLLSKLLSLAIPDAHADDVNKATNVAGTLAFIAGDLTAARPLLTMAAEQYLAVGDERGAGAAKINLGIVEDMSGNFAEAREAFESTLGLWRRLDRRRTLAAVLTNLGFATRELGDLNAARAYLDESLELQADLNDTLLRAQTLQNMASVFVSIDDVPAAQWHARESLRLWIVLEDKRCIADLLPLIVTILGKSRRLDKCAVLLGAVDAALDMLEAPLYSSLRRNTKIDLEAICAALGSDACASLIERGRLLPWDQIVAFALEAISY